MAQSKLTNICFFQSQARVQCFHYLVDKQKHSMSHIKVDTLEPDAKVLKLTKVLSEMDEALTSTLHPRKTKVIQFNQNVIIYLHSHFLYVLSTFSKALPSWPLAF